MSNNASLENSSETITKLLAGMSRELRCPICLSTLEEATTTPCSHTFCRSCIERIADEAGKCPLCKKEITKDHLNTAFSVQAIVKEFLKMREDFEKENEMDLSQVINPKYVSGTQHPLPRSPLDITNEDLPVSNVRSAVETRQLKVYLGSTEKPDVDIPNITFVDEINEYTTHILMDFADTERGLVKCNEQYLFGILYGCYIVDSKWLKLSIELNKIAPEERFEASGETVFGRTGAPKKSRANRNEGKHQKLFKGLRAKFISDDKITRRYQKYIRSGGGVVVDHGEIIVCSEDMDSVDVDEIQAQYPGKKLLSKDWVDECICKYELERKDKHYL